ncbi:hypothetical protein HN873_033009, partial [Arachis hypogaea]
MGVDADQSIIDVVDRELLQEQSIDRSQSTQPRDEEYRHASLLRDNIAFEIFHSELFDWIFYGIVTGYIMPNKGNKIAEANQPSKDNLRWSDDMDEVLLNALVEEASKGNMHDGSWTTEAYANVVKSLSIAIGPHITKNHIKNRMKTLKDHFVEAYDLFHHLSGFAWNPVTRKFEAEEEVWQNFIK